MIKTTFSFALFAAALNAVGHQDPAPIPPPTETAPVEMEQPEQMPMNYGSRALVEFKMGYFRFGDRKLRHAYDKGLLDLQLTATGRLMEPLYLYGGIEYVGADGRIDHHKKIKIRMVPLSLGLQYLQPITVDLKFYLTLGPRYFFVHQWKKRTSVTHHGLGGFANTGFLYYLSENIVVDFFGEYSYKRMRFHKLGGNEQVGGLTFGGGVGYFW